MSATPAPVKIGAYEVAGAIQGGSRPLYRAKAPDGRLVALKTLSASGVTEEEKQRFLRETEIARGLDHPNLLSVHDSGESDGVLFQAMELLDGTDLRKALAAGEQMDWPRRLSIMEQVLDGLAAAHQQGLVHRDIKPANVFLESSGRVRLLDFGMARVAASNLTRAGAAVGTLNYMAPEQLRGENCTPATDLFAAATVFYELSTGIHPFSHGETNLAKVLSNVMFLNPKPVTDAPEGLWLALSRALEKDPAKRFQSAADFKSALAICRITLQLGGQVSAAAAPTPVAAEHSQDLGATRVIRRSAAPAPPSAQPPPQPQAPAPAVAVPPPTPQPAAPPLPKSNLIYCTSCTHPNTPGSLLCARCGVPLSPGARPSSGGQSSGRPTLLLVLLIAAIILAAAAYIFLRGVA